MILASASTRRQQLLTQLGVNFSVSVQDINEQKNDEESPEEYVVRMADEKASAALLSRTKNDVVILAADTVVVCEDMVLGKPTDKSDGLRMLRRLSAKSHRVLSAVTVATAITRKSVLSETTVQFREISELEAEHYWQTGEAVDKAGAYGIQGYAAAFVKSISGSYSGVMGLPLYETAQLLRDFGIPVWQALQESV